MPYQLEKTGGGSHIIRLSIEEAREMMWRFDSKRVQCHINGKVTMHAAILPIAEGGYYIHVGKAFCKQAGIKDGDQLNVVFEADDTPMQFLVPEEFEAVMADDPEAKAVFDGLTDGNKRSLIYLVTQVKSSDKRIERALVIAEKLKMGIKNAQKMLKKP